jgi:hypothetical protein
MNGVLVLAGVVLVGATVADVAVALLGDSGTGGWVTGRCGRLAWRALAPSRRRQRHGPSHLLGRLIVLATPLGWLLGLWAGWTLVFVASPNSIVTTAEGAPASTVETVYFTGYTLFTLGNGELRPRGGLWQITTAVAALSGFAILSLAVTFIILVVQAATTRRRIAGTIALYGATPTQLSAALDDAVVDEARLASAIIELAETHAAFPALHYLHTTDETRSAPAMIANLGMALGRRRFADRATTETPLHRAIRHYLSLHPAVGASGEAMLEARLECIRLDDGRPPETRPSAAQ